MLCPEKGLDEFDESPAVEGLRRQPLARDEFAAIRHAQLDGADGLRRMEAGDSEGTGQKMDGVLQVRHDPADLSDFKAGDGTMGGIHGGVGEYGLGEEFRRAARAREARMRRGGTGDAVKKSALCASTRR